MLFYRFDFKNSSSILTIKEIKIPNPILASFQSSFLILYNESHSIEQDQSLTIQEKFVVHNFIICNKDGGNICFGPN